MDNNLIDSVYSNLLTMNRDGRQSDDILVEDELVHHMRKIAKELSYIVDTHLVTIITIS